MRVVEEAIQMVEKNARNKNNAYLEICIKGVSHQLERNH